MFEKTWKWVETAGTVSTKISKKKNNNKIKTKRPKAHPVTKRRVFLHSQKNLYIQRTHPTVYSVPNHLISKTKMVFLCHTYGNERNTF